MTPCRVVHSRESELAIASKAEKILCSPAKAIAHWPHAEWGGSFGLTFGSVWEKLDRFYKVLYKPNMHKPFLVRFSIILAILLLPHLASAETWYVKKSATKLQAEASARSEVLGKLQKGSPVKVKKKSGKFSSFCRRENRLGVSV